MNKYRLVIELPKSDGFHTRNDRHLADLTGQQRANGATVVAVVKAEPQPDLTAASKMLGKLLDGRKD